MLWTTKMFIPLRVKIMLPKWKVYELELGQEAVQYQL